MSKFKFSHGLFIGLVVGLISGLFINAYTQSTPIPPLTFSGAPTPQSIQTPGPFGLYIEQLPALPGGGIKYSMYFETVVFQHHGEVIEVDVHKLMNLLRTVRK